MRALYTGSQCEWVRAGGQPDSPGAGEHAHSHARAAQHELHADLTWVTRAPKPAALSRSMPSSCTLRGRRPPAVRAAVRTKRMCAPTGACSVQGADSHMPHDFNKAWPASA